MTADIRTAAQRGERMGQPDSDGGAGFRERMHLAQEAWTEYREANPFPLPERMSALFHAGFTFGMKSERVRGKNASD